MKILLIKLRALGDTVLFTATIERVAAAFPQAEITVLVPKAFASVVEGNPHVDHVWTTSKSRVFRWLMKVRRERFDYLFYLHATPRARVFCFLSKAKKTFWQIQNVKTAVPYGRHPNALEWDAFFLRDKLPLKVTEPIFPKVYLSSEEKEWGAEFWRAKGAEPDKVVFLGLGASRPTKRWPPEHFARLAELLRDWLELTPAIVVGPGEEEEKFAALVLDHMRVKAFRPQNGPSDRGGLVFVTGLEVRKLAAAMANVRAYVGNDSGPKHLAVALGIPTFTFFGPEDPGEWHPYSRDEHPVFFTPGLMCRNEDNGRWCGIPVCTKEGLRCMKDLRPEEALAVIQKKI